MDSQNEIDELDQLIERLSGRVNQRLLGLRTLPSPTEEREQELQAIRHIGAALYRLRQLRGAMATDTPNGLLH